MFKSLKKQLNEIDIHDFGLLDQKGIILMNDKNENEGSVYPHFEEIEDQKENSFVFQSILFSKIWVGRNLYYFYIKEQPDQTSQFLNLLYLNVKTFIKGYIEKYDKVHFLKGIITNNINISDVLRKASAFKMKNEEQRVVVVIRYRSKPDYPIIEIIHNIFSDRKEHEVLELDNEDILFIGKGNEEQAYGYTKTIIDTVEEELFTPLFAGIGSLCNDLTDLKKSYENACIALDSGVVFDEENSIFSYKALGIGKLLYKLDVTTLENYLKNTIDVKAFRKLDDEIIKTLQKFFDNNLNISETARQLYLHRNTLVYRIDKVMKNTGLDVRNFDDAVLFKVLYMIKCYIDKLKET